MRYIHRLDHPAQGSVFELLRKQYLYINHFHSLHSINNIFAYLHVCVCYVAMSHSSKLVWDKSSPYFKS
jgi:hypothetical protein